MAEERLSAVLFDTLTSVLREYERRSHLAEELLAAIEQTRARDKDVDADLQRLRECANSCPLLNRYSYIFLCKGFPVPVSTHAASQAPYNSPGSGCEMSMWEGISQVLSIIIPCIVW